MIRDRISPGTNSFYSNQIATFPCPGLVAAQDVQDEQHTSVEYVFLMKRLAALLLLFLGALPAQAGDHHSYGTVVIRSWHGGTNDLNNMTPGLTYGQRTRINRSWERFWEAGVFYNSYKEVSPLFVFGFSRHLFNIGSADIRGSGGVGTAYYKTLSHELRRDYGIPNIGGFIPIAVATLSARKGRTEVRLTTVPPQKGTTYILNLSVAVSF